MYYPMGTCNSSGEISAAQTLYLQQQRLPWSALHLHCLQNLLADLLLKVVKPTVKKVIGAVKKKLGKEDKKLSLFERQMGREIAIELH